ncbi:hypothetical protein BDW42DRAFT_201158 [Aspergillus taichungensis]|uniref:Nucleoside phosphorylase domain-containing protein n=1 Tax=Aspergillus taichungensis TaxID=482145 RepID=A0A2J5I861_9EURO|nr:hypothetical protein BDW42DRAFT_201158 [Aspergillus taichungensis]
MTRLMVDDYTVAWICALSLEVMVARVMLDKPHGSPSRANNLNAYDFGELNNHYITITYLPDSVYGTVFAATVVSRMCSTFPRLQFALMVGIGGGVPSKNPDIRLGDIVVGKLGKNHNGVVQYDYGKASLLTHITQLKSKQVMDGDDAIVNIVRAALERSAGMTARFSAPAQSPDFLFCFSYHHAEKGADCGNAPRVHYGLIVSRNQVMKDSVMRDCLSKQDGMLCFEMEASGLMNELPTLVIRGICDYCDSHKLDKWQGYAALAAAAYAKELLVTVSPENKIARRGQDTRSAAWTQFTEDEQACLANLLSTVHKPNFNSMKLRKGNWTSGTCSWQLESDKVKSWFKQDNEFSRNNSNLIMAITLAEGLSEKNISPLGIISDRQKTATSMLQGLLYQIISQYPELLEWIMPKYGIQKERLFTRFDALWVLLIDIGRINQTLSGSYSKGSVPSSMMFIITSYLGSRQEIITNPKTSIREKRVSQALEEKADRTFLWIGIACNWLNEPQMINSLKTLQRLPQDLHLLCKRLLDDAFTAETNEEDYQAIKEMLRLNTDSRLQFTRAIIDLCRLLVIVDKDCVRLLHRSVQDFLVTQISEMKALTANYALSCRCINAVIKNNRMKAQHAALAPEQAFLGYAVCWLENYNHLTKGIGHDLHNNHVFPFLSPEKREDKGPCGRTPILITAANAQVKTMRFLIESSANTLLEKGVSLYDCDKDNMTPFLYTVANLDERCAQDFLWRPNAKKEVAAPNLESGLTALHFSALNACTKITAFLLRYDADPNVRSEAGDTPLYLVIRCGLLGRECHDAWGKRIYAIESLRELIMDPASEEASDIDRAIDQARAHIVDTLLESEHLINFHQGADITRINGSHQTCLHLASKVRILGIVRRLVEEDQNILLEDINRLSPFYCALHEGYLEVLQYMAKACTRALLEVWNTPDHHGRTSLHHHVSSIFCDIAVVNFLIQTGCDVNQPDEGQNSSLGLYVGSFHLGVERMIFSRLVQEGADPLLVNAQQQNLLHLLMRHRGAYNKIIEYVFHSGIDPTARDVDGKIFMHYGAIHGAFTEELIEFLRCHGVLDLHTRDSISQSPLDYAEAKARQEFPDDILLHFDQK